MALDRGGIVTPEAVVLELQIAGVGSRLLAKLLDLVIMAAALLALGIGLNLLGIDSTPAIVISLLAVFLLFFGYPAISETWWRGKTVGKAALGIRVVTDTGAPIRVGHAVLRSIVGVVDFLIPPGGATAVVTALVTEKSQRLGDLAAGTVVLRDRLADRVAGSVTFVLPAGWEDYARSLDVARLNARQYNLVREFLVRADTMHDGARRAVAWKLAIEVAAVIGTDLTQQIDPHYFLNAVGWAWQQRGDLEPPPTFEEISSPEPDPAPASAPSSDATPTGWTLPTGGGGLRSPDDREPAPGASGGFTAPD